MPHLNEVLLNIVGKPVSSVDFVHDYVQISWEGSFLSAFTMPTIEASGVKYSENDPEYRQTLYRLEGQVLQKAALSDEALVFGFASGTILEFHCLMLTIKALRPSSIRKLAEALTSCENRDRRQPRSREMAS